jgi:hypothetical protein
MVMVLYIYNYIGVQTMTFKLVNIWNPKGGYGQAVERRTGRAFCAIATNA